MVQFAHFLPPLFSLLNTTANFHLDPALPPLTSSAVPPPGHHTQSPHTSVSYHPFLVTSLSTTVPGGGLRSWPRIFAKKRVLILLVTMAKVNFGL